MTEVGRIRTVHVAAVVFAWLLAAIAAGAGGLVQRMRPPAPQVLIFALAGCVTVLGLAVPKLRTWVTAVDVRVLVGLHLTRFVGIYFLVLYGRGQLPYAFAVPAGWGDIAVATGALALLATTRPTSPTGWTAYSIWNAVGLIDLLFVVGTAARLALQAPGSMQVLLQLPLSLLPTWLVPLLISTHLLLGVRLWDMKSGRR